MRARACSSSTVEVGSERVADMKTAMQNKLSVERIEIIVSKCSKTSNEKFNPYFAMEKLVALGGGCDVRSPEHGGGVASMLHGGDEEVLVR